MKQINNLKKYSFNFFILSEKSSYLFVGEMLEAVFGLDFFSYVGNMSAIDELVELVNTAWVVVDPLDVLSTVIIKSK